MTIQWREAIREDRAALESFTCTTEPEKGPSGRRLPHLRRWEYDVQAGIRRQRPPIGNATLLLGFDDEGLAAVAFLCPHSPGRSTVKILAVAVAYRCRKHGGGYADEALNRALEEAEAIGRGAGHSQVIVFGLVHPENAASKFMNDRAGLRYIEMEESRFEGDDDLERWEIVIPLDDEDAEVG